MKESEWEVYIIEAQSGTLYTGITNDLERRFEAHMNGAKGARFFRISSPKSIVFRESQANRSLASQRESQIKKMTRAQKLELILKKDPNA